MTVENRRDMNIRTDLKSNFSSSVRILVGPNSTPKNQHVK